jgi:hypothetical protein
MPEAAVSTQQSEAEYMLLGSALTLESDHVLSGKQIDVVPGFPRERPPRAWLGPVLDELQELLSLPEDWDSYGSARIDAHIARYVGRLLGVLARAETARPALVPTSAGGVQLEWHTRALELQLEIDPADDSIRLFYCAPGTGPWEGLLRDAPEPIELLLWQVAIST